MTLEIGPALAAVLGALVAGIVASIPAWLAYRQGVANKRTNEDTHVEVREIHKAVNNTASALAADAKVNEAKMEAMQARLLEVTKQLAAHDAAPATSPVVTPAAVVPAAAAASVQPEKK